MGTRSLTKVYDGGDCVVVMYRQMDGYPTGHGVELGEFLRGIEIVNGIGNQTNRIANGMGCLAGQIVAHFKSGVGNFYLVTDAQDHGQEYIYEVRNNGQGLKITVVDVYENKRRTYTPDELCAVTADDN
jgi:hypothetical protein